MNLLQLEFLFLFFLPGFAITFLVAWRRSRTNPNFFKITLWSILIGTGWAVLIVGDLLGFFFYSMRTILEDHYTMPLTVEQARQASCPIPLPDSARNIQFAFAYGGLQAFEILVRFEAPVDVCRAHVQTVINAHAAQEHEKVYTAYLRLLTTNPEPEKNGILGQGQAAWFDIEKIAHGETDDDPPGYDNVQFWIDDDRGIFYYKITD